MYIKIKVKEIKSNQIMLNTFPELLNYSIYGVFALRVFVGFSLAYFGLLKITKDRGVKLTFFKNLGFKTPVIPLYAFALTETIFGLFVLVGFLTQISAIILGLIMLLATIIKLYKRTALPNEWWFYFLYFLVFVFLLLNGAGIWAIDLPL